jgi:hypothetical protein
MTVHQKDCFFNIQSKIPHKFANLVLICESQSNQRRPNLTWDLGFAFIDQMVPVNNWPQVIDLVIHIHEFGVRSLNLIAITILLIHIRYSFLIHSTLCYSLHVDYSVNHLSFIGLTSLFLYCSLVLP